MQRRRFPVGANPIRQPLQPEAIGAVMEVTKWLKPSISVSQNWRFSRLLLPGFRRRSTMRIATLAFASAGLLHPHVPFDEAANLTLGIAASHHARDKLAVLLFGIAVLFRAKRDNRKKVFDLRKYPFLDDFSNLFIAGPGRVFATVLCP